jgi:hypothetical protein
MRPPGITARMTSHTNALPRLVSRLSLATEPGAPLGGELDERRIRLLEAIDRLGS